ncbi:MAG: methyltransferase domain-containing protein [Steroidobacteraceae bacterium]
MEASLQRRVQRYGWDRAAADYESLWQVQLAGAQSQLLASASLAPGDRVLDVACGSGLVTFSAAHAVGPTGRILGIDLSGQMIAAARRRAEQRQVSNASFARMDAETLSLPDGSFDVVLCCLGLMYVPDPEKAVREMKRVLRPGGRLVISVWGERSACGWAALFPIIDVEVSSEVCPLFFRLGQGNALARLCIETGVEIHEQHRLAATLCYADAREACNAAFIGGPVALAWSRFDEETRARVCQRYVEAIAAWQHDSGYRIPGEFVVVAGVALDTTR